MSSEDVAPLRWATTLPRASGASAASALAVSTGFVQLANGYSGTDTDGYRDLIAHHGLSTVYTDAATPGNLVQTARIPGVTQALTEPNATSISAKVGSTIAEWVKKL